MAAITPAERGAASFGRLPGDDLHAANAGITAGAGNHQHEPSAVQGKVLGKIEKTREIPVAGLHLQSEKM